MRVKKVFLCILALWTLMSVVTPFHLYVELVGLISNRSRAQKGDKGITLPARMENQSASRSERTSKF